MQTLQESDMKKSSRSTPGWRVALCCLSEGTGCASSLAAKSTAPGSGLYLPQLGAEQCCVCSCCTSGSVVGLAAPEDSSSGEHTPREPVVSPSVFWQKSYCFTDIPRAWNMRVRGVCPCCHTWCCQLLPSLSSLFDHDLISGNVLDHWSFTQAGKRWEGSLGTDLEDLWHRICVQHMSNQINNSKARAVGSRNEINATKCQCLHFLVSLCSLTPCSAGVCPALGFFRKWPVSAGSVRGLRFLPRGKKG